MCGYLDYLEDKRTREHRQFFLGGVGEEGGSLALQTKAGVCA